MSQVSFRKIKSGDERHVGWSGLQRYRNVAYVSDLLAVRHGQLGNNPNIKKQATQIRFCLQQASDYRIAAEAVSISTKPLLLYYSAMSLALAEILLKQSGESSLDRAREQHRHHGLLFGVRDPRGVAPNRPIEGASELFAVPAKHGNKRHGTFELWHRTASESPLGGRIVEKTTNGDTNDVGAIFAPDKKRRPLFPEEGASLLDCMLSLPRMRDFVQSYGLTHRSARTTLSLIRNHIERFNLLTVIFHPELTEILEQVYSQITCAPSDVSKINIHEFSSGCRLTFRPDELGNIATYTFPGGVTNGEDETLFFADPKISNEFGLIYVALFIAGNYARYYPDKWMSEVERSSGLALGVQELCRVSEDRMALLTLSEFSGTYYVTE